MLFALIDVDSMCGSGRMGSFYPFPKDDDGWNAFRHAVEFLRMKRIHTGCTARPFGRRIQLSSLSIELPNKKQNKK